MKRKLKFWHGPNQELNELLPDPRIAVTKWTGWDGGKRISGREITHWSYPEPDNLNCAIWDRKKHFIEGIQYQMWYRDRARGGWFSVYAVDDIEVFNEYVFRTPILAYWDYSRYQVKRRTRLTRIEEESRRWNGVLTKEQHTLEERLYLQGMVDKLIEKGADRTYIENIFGRPRDFVYESAGPTEEYTED